MPALAMTLAVSVPVVVKVLTLEILRAPVMVMVPAVMSMMPGAL